MSRRAILLTLALAGLIPANAQYSFSISVEYTGACRGEAQRWANMWLNQYKPQASGIPSSQDCEKIRQIVNSLSYSSGYGKTSCGVKFKASPCTGRPMSGPTVGVPNVKGVDQGTSFYSTNNAQEISDWSKNHMEQVLALNKNAQEIMTTSVSTGDDEYDKARSSSLPVIDPDKPFRSINLDNDLNSNNYSSDLSMRDGFNKVELMNDYSLLANKENVQRYIEASQNLLAPYLANPQDLTSLLHKDFTTVSGFDVDAIMQKLPSERTAAEKQALIDYQEYRKGVTDKMLEDLNEYIARLPETKDFEMAVLAENCYKNSEHNYLSRTNYQLVNSDFFPENTQMRKLADLIKECNATNSETGFHAELYFNKKTNEYTIAFEGTNKDEKLNDWIKADAVLGFGGVPEQYRKAYEIAELLNRPDFPSDTKINLTGHSLGGGLASIVGLATG